MQRIGTARHMLAAFSAALLLCGIAFVVAAPSAFAAVNVSFHLNPMEPAQVQVKRSVDAASTVDAAYKVAGLNGALCSYGSTEDRHYLFHRLDNGSVEYHARAAAQSSYPAQGASDALCLASHRKVGELATAAKAGNNLHLYLFYSQAAHTWKTKTVASCTAEGTLVCSACARTKKTPALGHVWRFSHTHKSGAAIAAGKHRRYCTRCQSSSLGTCAYGGATKCRFCKGALPHKLIGKASVSGVDYLLYQDRVAVLKASVSQRKKITKLIIPAAVKKGSISYRVTTIAASSFKSAPLLASVRGGASLTTVGGRAFASCSRLTGVSLSTKRLTTLGANCFAKCKKLKSFNCNSRVTGAQLKRAGLS